MLRKTLISGVTLVICLLVYRGIDRRIENRYKVVYPRHQNSTQLLNRIDRERKAPPPKNRKFAVMVCGLVDDCGHHQMLATYRSLLKNGFPKNNIYILEGDGKSIYGIEDFYPIDDSATIDSISTLFAYLERRVTNRDLLLVYISDHGELKIRPVAPKTSSVQGLVGGEWESTIVLWDKEMGEKYFANRLNRIHPRVGIYMFTQCYSGGFAERLAGPGRITIATSQKEKQSYSDGSSMCFSTAFFEAFHNPSSDADKDGKISVREAFKWARVKDKDKAFNTPFIRYGLDRDTSLKEP